jgi:hypothetical protein
MTKILELANGKYTIIYDFDHPKHCVFKALRYGEEWRDLMGDNLIIELISKIEELESKK